MNFLPLFLDLSKGHVILVGSSAPAVAKLNVLRSAGAKVRWFSPQFDLPEELLLAANEAGQIGITIGEPDAADIADAFAIVSAAGVEIDERIAAEAKRVRIPVNVVDRPDLSTFIFPAVVDRGDVVVAIGTGGASPVLARRLRERIEEILPARIGAFAGLMKRYRSRLADVRQRHPLLSFRRFWEGVIDGPIGAAFLAGNTVAAEASLVRAIDGAGQQSTAARGVVHLVGAGPGDPDLLTLRALHVLQSADVIYYDDLVTAQILDRARRDAERVFVGKRKGAPGIGQAEINRRLIESAKQGNCTVRLKGGDPFVFGRGGEELEAVEAAGIPVHVVPGITAALGCAAEAALPLTFRKEATQLTLITANTAEGAGKIDWSTLTDPGSTVVVYMGLSTASAVRSGLIAAGRDPHTPVAVLARGTRPDSKAAVGRLEYLPGLATLAGEGPALLVIGDAVARSAPWKAAQAALARVAA